MQFYRDLPLRWVAVAVALLIAAVWVGGLLATEKFRRALLRFPRNFMAGVVLISITAVWCTAIVSQANSVNILAPKWVGYFIIWFLCVGSVIGSLDYLAVRALSALLLMIAKVMVDAAFTVDTPARLLVPVLAYVWVILGMWWPLSPWRCRNAIEWMTASDARTKAVSGVHLAIALVLVVFAFAFY